MKRIHVRPWLAGIVVFAAACSSDEITAPTAPVASVAVHASAAVVYEADTLQFRAEVRDAEGNELQDRNVTWASSDASILVVAEDGKAIARKAGAVSVTATSEGRSATVSLAIQARPAAPSQYMLKNVGGRTLPLTVDSAEVSWNGVREMHVVRLEQGAMEISGTPLRYRLVLAYQEYRVVNGPEGPTLQHVMAWPESDRGIATWGDGGSLSMISEVVSPLSHTGHRDGPGLQVDYRIGGTDTHLILGFEAAS